MTLVKDGLTLWQATKKEAVCCSFATKVRAGRGALSHRSGHCVAVISNVRAVEHENVDAAASKGLHVDDGSLAFGAGEGVLNRGRVVEM